MAKMFYSLEEAAAKLDKSESEVREMAARGEVTEFRDGDKLIFKVDQIDLLAGDDATADSAAGMSSMIPLADSGTGMSLGLDASGTGAGLEEPTASGDDPGASGVSVFDADDSGDVDPSADTLVSGEGDLDNVSLESFGSGSGLMDLTRESDDTGLGAEGLLDELYAGDDAATADTTAVDADLFEGAAAADDLVGAGTAGGGGATAAVAAEPYDGSGSGLAAGLSIGALIALIAGLGIVTMGMIGAPPEFVAGIMDGNLLIPVAGLLGLTLLLGGIGFFLGGRG